MTVPSQVNPLQFGGSSGYQIPRSVRLRSSASAYFNRTLTTPTAQNIWTQSFWLKRGSLGGYNNFGLSPTGANTQFYFDSANPDCLSWIVGASTVFVTTQVFRDPAAWYHIILAFNGGSGSNKVRLYVNGLEVTSFSTDNRSTLTTTTINTAIAHGIGCYYSSVTNFFDGYLAEVNFIDGQQLTPSSFGYTDSNGIWQPKTYTGTYGTNGFYLTFNDNSAATATTLGKDYSGNGNNWTPNNISVTAGVTYDSMVDSPTVGYAASNYAVLNPLNASIQPNLQDANLAYSYGSVAWRQAISSMQVPTSGKWYCEFTTGASGTGGGVDIGLSDYLDNTYRLYRSGGNKASNSGGIVAYGSSFSAAGTVVGLAVDTDNGTLTFYNNNTSQGVAYSDINSAAPATGWYFGFQANNASTQYVNFGQRPFVYTPPTGFKALNTYNLPLATINNGATVMAASTYTGTGATQSIVNSGNNAAAISFKPDLVWVKKRSATGDHKLTDSVRGTTKALVTDSTAAETTDANGLTAFGSNGFTLGSNTIYNANAATFVAWQWQAGQGTTSSNTNGTITSTVSVNQSTGFSIATFSPPGSGVSTFGHGLGVAPKFVITKQRASVGSWTTYHASIGNTQFVYLDLTDAAATGSTVWNNTSPTSTVVTLGTAFGGAGTMVAYCWAEVAGYSKFGSYTGNGSANGPFVYCGFRPRWVMIKNASATPTSWWIYDTSRNTYNQDNTVLYANTAAADLTSTIYGMDILSNGFKLRNADDGNTSGSTIIYAAFAENPFNISRAR